MSKSVSPFALERVAQRRKRFELQKQLWKKEEYIGSLFSQLDNIKIKEFQLGITEESSRKRRNLVKRIEINVVELKKLKMKGG